MGEGREYSAMRKEEPLSPDTDYVVTTRPEGAEEFVPGRVMRRRPGEWHFTDVTHEKLSPTKLCICLSDA
jgi:hypothetical protein